MDSREFARRFLAQRSALGEDRLEDALTMVIDDARKMGLPVSGYTAQPDAKVALVNEFKADEERLLRKLDWLKPTADANINAIRWVETDPRWVAVARTHFQEGFMALNRAVFQPQRIKLPEDGE